MICLQCAYYYSTVNGNDFSLASLFLVTFTVGSSNSSTLNIPVTLFNDDFVEGPEAFDLSISNVISTASASAGSSNTSTVLIIDNDCEL